MDPAQIISGYLSAFLVQIYFAYCIFRLKKGNPTVVIVIVALALTQVAAGITEGAQMAGLVFFSKLDSIKATICIQSVATVLCDILITVTLCVILHSKKSSIKSTNTALGKLIVFGINRGAFTSLAAAVNLILFLAVPGTFYFFLGLTVSSKLYMNGLLSTLNTRQYVANSSHLSHANSSHPWQSIPLGQVSRTGESQGVSIQSTKINFNQSQSPMAVDDKNFTSSMI